MIFTAIGAKSGCEHSTNENNLTPTIYLNKYFEQYENGKDMMDILVDIANEHTENAVDFNLNINSM